MKTTILGGGNVGTLMAAEFAAKGHDVTVYTSKPEKWSNEIEVYDSRDRLLKKGTVEKVTDSIEDAVTGAEYIWVVVPAQLFSSLSKKMTPYLMQQSRRPVTVSSAPLTSRPMHSVE